MGFKNKKLFCLIMVGVLLVGIMSGCGQKPTPQAKEKVIITMPTWTGYAPLILANEKGFFAKQGVEVEVQVIEGLGERKQALAANRVQGMATALDVNVTMAAADIPMQVVWMFDDSFGGDGLLVKSDIEKIEDLKGKKVALEVGTTSHFFFLTLLKQANVDPKDLTIVDMRSGDAGAAFVAGQVDGAVTWQPWLSKGVQESNGTLLATSKDTPGVIADALSLRKDLIDSKPEVVKGIVAGLAEAMQYWKDHKDESDQIMAKGLSITVEEFVATVEDLKFYDAAANKEFFGTEDNLGAIVGTLNNAVDFYSEEKIIDKKPEMADFVNPTFVNSVN
jgi:NitT/TauT family transport system substrate-binding protein